MKRSKFKIGQVSSWMGSPRDLRYYERKKIISPLKDGLENGLPSGLTSRRVHSGQGRTYLRYGFSLEEARSF